MRGLCCSQAVPWMPACRAGDDLLASKSALLGITVSHVRTSRSEKTDTPRPSTGNTMSVAFWVVLFIKASSSCKSRLLCWSRYVRTARITLYCVCSISVQQVNPLLVCPREHSHAQGCAVRYRDTHVLRANPRVKAG